MFSPKRRLNSKKSIPNKMASIFQQENSMFSTQISWELKTLQGKKAARKNQKSKINFSLTRKLDSLGNYLAEREITWIAQFTENLVN